MYKEGYMGNISSSQNCVKRLPADICQSRQTTTDSAEHCDLQCYVFPLIVCLFNVLTCELLHLKLTVKNNYNDFSRYSVSRSISLLYHISSNYMVTLLV